MRWCDRGQGEQKRSGTCREIGRVGLSIVFVQKQNVGVRDELEKETVYFPFSVVGQDKNSHRFDALSAFAPAHVDTENAMAAPFAFSSQPIKTSNVAQGCFNGAAFKVQPVEWSRTVWVG